MNNIDLVKNNQAMIKSGALTIHNPMWDKIKAKLEHMRIRAGTPLPEMKHLLNINGVNCFPRGDLVAISGKEKCGKTTPDFPSRLSWHRDDVRLRAFGCPFRVFRPA